MFTRQFDETSADRGVTFRFEGRPIQARPGDSVATALLLAGIENTRTTPVSGSPRAPYCMMGICYECLMVIDGQPDRQACLIQAKDGMEVTRQVRAPEVSR